MLMMEQCTHHDGYTPTAASMLYVKLTMLLES
jgi:hypothetical protein